MKNTLLAAISASLLLTMGSAAQETVRTESAALYRLPFADGTSVQVFDDFTTHRPVGRVGLFATGGKESYRVVAAAAGRIMAIQDSFSDRQSGRAAADCHNNCVRIAHPNGEWTKSLLNKLVVPLSH